MHSSVFCCSLFPRVSGTSGEWEPARAVLGFLTAVLHPSSCLSILPSTVIQLCSYVAVMPTPAPPAGTSACQTVSPNPSAAFSSFSSAVSPASGKATRLPLPPFVRLPLRLHAAALRLSNCLSLYF